MIRPPFHPRNTQPSRDCRNPFGGPSSSAIPRSSGRAALSFRDMLAGQLEVAMGLETAHPGVLERLNKHMTLEQFRRAAEFLTKEDIGLRVFILVRPPMAVGGGRSGMGETIT